MITSNNIFERSNVLFINNSKTDLLIMEALLNKHFNIINVTNVNDAIGLLDEMKVDIIISNELYSNELNTRVQIIKKIKLDRQYSNIKFFALHQPDKKSHYYIKQGFDDAFSNPVLKEEIFAAL